MGPSQERIEDPVVRTLADLFRTHPAWVEAGRHLAGEACSKVFFSHLPGEPWQLLRAAGRSELRPGAAPDPDLAFRFTPAGVRRLAETEGTLTDFALTLFDLILTDDAEVRVGLRVIAPFERLVQRGYVRLILAGGPRVLVYGFLHAGARSLSDLRALIDKARAGPEDWET